MSAARQTAGALAHDPGKWEPVSRRSLCSGRPKAGPECEARFGGRRKVGQDRAASRIYIRSASQRPAQVPLEPMPCQVPVPELSDRRPVPLAPLSPTLMLTLTAPLLATVPAMLTSAL